MAYSVHHYTGGAWVDISNYVITAFKYPLMDRERNYEPRATGISFDVSWNYSNELLNGDDIKIEDGSSNVVYSGYILEAKKDYDSRVINVQVNNSLLKLNDKQVVIDDMWQMMLEDLADFGTYGLAFGVLGDNQTINVGGGHGMPVGAAEPPTIFFNMDLGDVAAYKCYYCDIISSTQFKIYEDVDLTEVVTITYDVGSKFIYVSITNIDGNTFRTGVGFSQDYDRFIDPLYLIKQMFTDAGLTLDISSVESELIGNFDIDRGAALNTQNIDMNELFISLTTLSLINQSTNTIDNNSLITYWQFIVPFMAMTGTIIKCTGFETYTLYKGLAENAVHDDDDFWQYGEAKIEAKYAGVKMQCYFRGNVIDEIADGDGTINWLNNYVLLFSASEGPEGDFPRYAWLPSLLNTSGVDVALKYYKRALLTDYTEKRYKINRYTTATAFVQNMVNISITEPVSEIVEEVY